MEKYNVYKIIGFNKMGSVIVICVLLKMYLKYLIVDFIVLVFLFDDFNFKILYIGFDLFEDENFKF